ncbi:DUF6314 family protein [Promicromonospora iranensis]|uniref:DUF6314 domain-containing protein n=1 Tax=Promicromonospora iranensis TaxID=1105144 RepID=A0ABU2CVP0_9MICO|nr:DUF6314 family protein [Promicromonospora iranensis]MDR7385409.1 hypothetical protein [Promicromonospora iranensis]
MDPLRLVGTWDFRREVQDHRDGSVYTARGEATFRAEDDGRIRWTENGTLTWPAGSTPVTRTLFLVREEPGGLGSPSGWRVTFEDGRDFHPWTAGAVEHLCGRDLYQGGMALPPGPPRSWELSWRVRGPEKDYTMRTRYSRPFEVEVAPL